MISKFGHLPRQQHIANYHHHHHYHPNHPNHQGRTSNSHNRHHHHQQHLSYNITNMNLAPNNLDGVKINNNNISTNHGSTGNNHTHNNATSNTSNHDIELMMELPPASPISQASHASHATMHRSVSQSNNNVHGVNGHSSRVASAADDFTMHKPHSLSLSRATLTSREFGVEKTLTALGVLALIAIILSALSIVLLIQFNGMQNQVLTEESMVIGVTGTRWYADILDSGVVLASFCLMLNLCCVVVCTGQSYFTAKMLKLPQGEERSCEFLKNTSGSRFLAVCSFFVSIPVFLIALILYILLEFRTIPATVSSALIGLAILFMIFSFGHNVHLWHREQSSTSRRQSPPLPGVFTGMNGGVNHRQNHHHGTETDGHRFAYSNHVTGDGVDGALEPLSVSNLSTLV